jgi:hypothetical protein
LENSSQLHENNIKIGYLNIQGLNNKNLIVSEFATDNLLDMLCLSEHWSRDDEILYEGLDNYHLINSFCREHRVHGGVAIYVNKYYAADSVQLNLNFLCVEFDFEITAIIIEKIHLVVIVVYRSPDGDSCVFLDRLDDLFNFFVDLSGKNIK